MSENETRVPTMSFRWAVPSAEAYVLQPTCARLQQLHHTSNGDKWIDVPMVEEDLPEAKAVTRDWNMNMDEAPQDRTIEVVARYPDATAGFPRYVSWREDLSEPGWYEFSRNAPIRVIPWAWRERTDWPEEPRKPQ